MRALPETAGGILGYFTRHATAANLLMALLLILGAAAIPNLRAQFFPDVVVERIFVNVAWDGAGAEDVDRAVVAVLEPSMLSVEGVVSVDSTSQEGAARIALEFEPGWDTAEAMDQVQLTLDQAQDLPDGTEDPVVYTTSWSDRVTDVVLTGPLAIDQLSLFADEFVTRLFAEGITQTTISGVAAGEILVEVPSAALVQHDISMAEIARVISSAADANPAGEVSAANARIRAGTERREISDVAALVMRRNADGTTLSLGDVAEVTRLGIDRDRAFLVGDEPAIRVRVERSQRGDALAIQAITEEVAAELQGNMPEGSEIRLTNSLSEVIQARLNILLDNGLYGFGLVILLLFLFLNARTAFWVAAGIPVAMMATLAIMFAAGLTINMISLFALIITLGIVVDDAIVVGEHADFRARSLGESPAVAAESAARRMAAPVFSATVTTVIAFAGLTAIGGRFGDLIMAIPFTVIAVLAASLIECFLILPHHMKNALVHSANDHWYDWPSRQVNRGFEWVRERGFRPFVKWMIWARYPVLAAAILALAVQISSFLAGDVTWRFFNPPEQSRVTANVIMADEASRADTIAMLQELQRAANQVGAELAEEHGADPVLFALSQLGATDGAPSASTDNKDSDQLGSITIDLIDPDLRPYSSFLFVDSMRDAVRESALTEQVSFRSWRRGPQGEAIDVELFGGDTDILKAAAEALTAALSQYPEVSSPGDNLAYDRDELSLSLTPQGEALGFDIDSLGMVLGNRLGGIEAASFPDGPRTATIRVELPATELTADFLDTTLLRAESGAYVPLADIVEVETRSGFSRILRENGIITVSVSADMSEDDPERAAAILAELENRVLPQIASEFGIGFQMAGLAEQERDFLSDAMLGLALCLAGIYIVLAWIFASWTRPLVVMAIIPFGLIGTIYGHAAWDVPMSMFTVVGLIGMTGIIINDSIVLVTTIDEKAQKISWNEAIVDGVADRLRPVLLTTLTTVLGLTPLLYEGSSQAEFLKPTVITLVYGLGVGMVIVLLVVPAIMAMQSDFADRMRALRRAVTPRHGRMGLPLAVFATGAVIAAWFAATMGAFITSGTAAFALPIGDSGLTQAFVSFILGAALISAMSVSIAAFRSSTS